jgi:HTH-type transcriptional regulator, glycine betaine synthesis regulator
MSERETPMEAVAEQIGAFIQYWGFKKIHGRIWAHVFLAEKPVGTDELIRRLGVSKALMSMSIADLLAYDVIREAGKGPRGVVRYSANPDVTRVIFNVLRARERKMLASITESFKALRELPREQSAGLGIDPGRVDYLGEMIRMAEQALDSFTDLNVPAEDLTDRLKILDEAVGARA